MSALQPVRAPDRAASIEERGDTCRAPRLELSRPRDSLFGGTWVGPCGVGTARGDRLHNFVSRRAVLHGVIDHGQQSSRWNETLGEPFGPDTDIPERVSRICRTVLLHACTPPDACGRCPQPVEGPVAAT